MYTFYVVVRHLDTGVFQPLLYSSDNEVLTEHDLFEIEHIHADTSRGYVETKTQIISWQRIDVKE